MEAGVILAVLFAIGAGVAVMVSNMKPKDSPTREELLEADLEQAKMLARLFDDPDFVKDMGLTDEEQRYLNR